MRVDYLFVVGMIRHQDSWSPAEEVLGSVDALYSLYTRTKTKTIHPSKVVKAWIINNNPPADPSLKWGEPRYDSDLLVEAHKPPDQNDSVGVYLVSHGSSDPLAGFVALTAEKLAGVLPGLMKGVPREAQLKKISLIACSVGASNTLTYYNPAGVNSVDYSNVEEHRNGLLQVFSKAELKAQQMSYAENFCLCLAKNTNFRPMVASWKGGVTVVRSDVSKTTRIARTPNKNFKPGVLEQSGMSGHKAQAGLNDKNWVLALLRQEKALLLNPTPSVTDLASQKHAERYLHDISSLPPDSGEKIARLDAKIEAVVANKVILRVTDDGFTRLPYEDWYHREKW